jgi:carbamoyl-phosphate synthase large subunit
MLQRAGIPSERINKIAEGSPHVLDVIATHSLDLVINNAAGPRELNDGYRIRRAAVEAGIPSLTSLDTARALASAMESTSGPPRSLQAYQAARREPVLSGASRAVPSGER